MSLASLSGCSERAGRFVQPQTDGGLDSQTAVDGSVRDSIIYVPDTGAVEDDCSNGARWVYLVDTANNFLRFEPNTDTLTRVGELDCPTNADPFSMAVDRDAIAWVLYGNGDVFRVDTQTLECRATNFDDGRSGTFLFGMGFSSSVEDPTSETLFVSGSTNQTTQERSTFGSLDTQSLRITDLGQVLGKPELTGNSLGELWGFSPRTSSQPPRIMSIDKSNGSVLQSFNLNSIRNTEVTAWAFAHWGARYYVFIAEDGSDSQILRFNPATQALDTIREDAGYRIVGAGVSTCAPAVIL